MWSRRNEKKVEAGGRGGGTGDKSGDIQGDMKNIFCRNWRRKCMRHRETDISGTTARIKLLKGGDPW